MNERAEPLSCRDWESTMNPDSDRKFDARVYDCNYVCVHGSFDKHPGRVLPLL